MWLFHSDFHSDFHSGCPSRLLFVFWCPGQQERKHADEVLSEIYSVSLMKCCLKHRGWGDMAPDVMPQGHLGVEHISEAC